MKPVYMCEYCGKMGDARTIEEHEKECIGNPANKNCYTCKHAKSYDRWVCYCDEDLLGNRSALDKKECWENGRTQKYTTP